MGVWLDVSGCAVGAAAVTLAGVYAGLHPASQLFGRTVITPRMPGKIALTFDDGPNPEWTPRLLDSLGERGVKATFFVVGRYAAAEPALVRRIAAEGHAIGNHSWSHPNLAWCAASRIREELTRTSDELAQILGAPVALFRPPFGARRPAVLRIARELGLTPVLWNAMTSDWSATDAERVTQELSVRIWQAHRRGSAATVVLHDGGHLVPAADRGVSVRAAVNLVDRFGAEAFLPGLKA